MLIDRERLQRTLAKTMLGEHTSEKGLFALTYDVSTGSAPTFSRRDSWKRKSCASTQLPPRTYYFNYDKNLVNELFSSQNSYTFSRYSYDAPTDTNIDEIYYYIPYLNMQRLFENINRIIDMTMEKPQDNMDYPPFDEQRARKEERGHFNHDDAKQRLMNNDAVMNKGGDSGGTIPYNNYGIMAWTIASPSYYVTSTSDHVSDPPNGGNSGICQKSNTLNITTPNATEGI